ncbi:MAG: hypothetical protein JW702_03415 [Clostridiales bacterium]|nr:hypothetical protein [Clostridiales bacterium]
MNRRTKSMVIVIILIILAPIVGYFGTKYILLKMNSNSGVIEQEVILDDNNGNIDLEPLESNDAAEEPEKIETEDNKTGNFTYSIILKERSVVMIQLASLSTYDGAQKFINQNNPDGIIFEKDGLFKAVYSAYFSNNRISDILLKARENYSDAFTSTGTLKKKTIIMELNGEIDVQLLNNQIDEYFNIIGQFSEFAAALVNSETSDSLGKEINEKLNKLVVNDIWNHDFGKGFLELIDETKAVAVGKYSGIEDFNKAYNDLLEDVFSLYH